MPINVCLIGGGLTATGLTICGPVCAPPEQCTTTASQLVNVCVPVLVRPFAFAGPSKTICCGPATIGSSPCPGIPGGVCSFTVSQLICVEIPIIFGSHARTTETYVECGDTAIGACECPPLDD